MKTEADTSQKMIYKRILSMTHYFVWEDIHFISNWQMFEWN